MRLRAHATNARVVGRIASPPAGGQSVMNGSYSLFILQLRLSSARYGMTAGPLSCVAFLLLFLCSGFWTIPDLSLSRREAIGLWSSASENAGPQLFRVVGLFDNRALLLNGTSMWARAERETFAERLHRQFPRSEAEKRFKRKTAVSGQVLVMNAALIFRTGSSYTTTIETFSHGIQLLMVFRASLTEQGPSDLYFVHLDSQYIPFGEVKQLSRARTLGGAWYGPPWREDARFFVWRETLCVSYTVTSAYERNKHAYQVWQRQAYALLDADLNRKVSDVFLGFGNNAEFVSTVFPTFEKNWLFFAIEDALHAIVSITPFVLLRVTELVNVESFVQCDWSHAISQEHGTLRGSAPPVKAGEFWFVFTHSVEYAVYVLALSADASTPMYITSHPVISASEQMFVCGAVFIERTKHWLVSAGLRDRQVVLLTLPHATIMNSLSPVKIG